MIGKVLSSIFGSKYERDVKRYIPIVQEINRIYESLSSLSEEELVAKTTEFKAVIAEREEKGEELQKILDDLLPEAYAVVKEACRRNLGREWEVTGFTVTWDMVPYDVQLMGAIALHEGKVAEMATGEGKTLAATMPAYLNALAGKGMHIVTVNDYLARRDAQWMGGIYQYLGLTVGCIQGMMPPAERRVQYSADITYGTNSEFGFDYLRDNGLAMRPEDCVQRDYYYAIIDEVDSVLIDEARTPLIISGPVPKDRHHYPQYTPMVERLFSAQRNLVARELKEAEEILEDEDNDKNSLSKAGTILLKAKMGLPKNRRLLKLMEEGWVMKLVEDTERAYMREKSLPTLREELYFSIDEQSNAVELSEKGRQYLSPNDPELFLVPDIAEGLSMIDGEDSLNEIEKQKARQKVAEEFEEKNNRLSNIQLLLKSYALFEKDVDYIVKDGRVIIVDQFTGRLMPSRRYSDGLHQALEAKEGVAIEQETQTLATVTIQNYFRMYEKRAGMTGTAVTEAAEFFDIYKMDTILIPTNEPVRRVDCDNIIYRTKREKYNAILEEVIRQNELGRPVLVGTISVDVSEKISRMLSAKGIQHSVLNAKLHQKEAEIVRFAGQPGTVTIATNMAGRGTDIKLGEGVVKCKVCVLLPEPGAAPDHPEWESKCRKDMPCGLAIIGTERHEARRIDRQLRGRSGRQGDPGSTRFFVSLEDDLMRLFGSDRMSSMLANMGMEEGQPIESGILTRTIETAQKRVEEQNFAIRKRVLDYDDVMNKQREVIYDLRSQMLKGKDIKANFFAIIDELLDEQLPDYISEKVHPEEWDVDGLAVWMMTTFAIPVKVEQLPYNVREVQEYILELITKAHSAKEQELGEEQMRQLERLVILSTVDIAWKEHLYEMDIMREGIGLRSYGGLDPLVEYKSESFRMFKELLSRINQEVATKLFHVRLSVAPQQMEKERERAPQRLVYTRTGDEAREPVRSVKPKGSDGKKVGPNDPCPCGSGKKYKKCCMSK